MQHLTLTEPCGCRWAVMATELHGTDRAFWVYRLLGDVSQAMPNICGFYARDLADARYKLDISA